jgi:hypothetical protein
VMAAIADRAVEGRHSRYPGTSAASESR